MKIHKTFLVVLYLMAFSFAIAVAVKGFGYYTLPLKERPHDLLHPTLKPGGDWGHGLGILGSAMTLLLFLYSVRKRNVFGLRFGKIKNWLNIHIFFGIMGPIFVTLHTAFKFGGLVSVSYFSMIAVMLSGFVGRYLYVQIPRTLSGDELSMEEMEERNKYLTKILVGKYSMNPELLYKIKTFSGVHQSENPKRLAALLAIIKNDLTRPFKLRKLKKQILHPNQNIPAGKIHALINVINQKAVLMRKMTFLSSIQPLFHYWHVAHKPFAYVMIIIMFLHIGVTLLFGFRWIF